jgi:hypothetical protein
MTRWGESSIVRGSRRQFAAGVDKTLSRLGKINPEERGSGGKNEIYRGRDQMLVSPVELAEATLGASPVHRVADRCPGGDHAHTGGSGGFTWQPAAPRELKDPAIDATALLTNGAKITVAPQALPGAETHDQTTVRRLRPLRRREAMTLRPPRVALRARKPILRARFLRCGRNVGFIDLWQKEGQVRRASGGVSSESFCPERRPRKPPEGPAKRTL